MREIFRLWSRPLHACQLSSVVSRGDVILFTLLRAGGRGRKH